MLNSTAVIESGWEALDRGDLTSAAQVGVILLEEVPSAAGRWDEGNLVHMGHLLLGHVALRQGNVDEAGARLLEAGRTPGSPQLDSFGPNMSLAARLLEAGRPAVVLEYFDECERFWRFGRRSLK